MSLEFLITSLIVVVSPGTGVLFTLATGLSRGSRASIVAALRIHFPHGGRLASSQQRQPREQSTEHSMAHDEIGWLCTFRRQRVKCRRREREQYALLAQALIDRCDACGRNYDVRCGSAEKSAHGTEAFGARHEHPLAHARGNARAS